MQHTDDNATNDSQNAPSDSSWGDEVAQSGSEGVCMRVGTAYRDITPDKPLALLGQMAVRIAERTRDPITVNAIVFDDGTNRVALVSADVCVLTEELPERMKKASSEATGIPVDDITVSATHTHVAPCTTGQLFGDVDEDWLDFFVAATAEAVCSAVDNLEQATVFAGSGWLDNMGWNRRGLRSDGACHMYHGSWQDEFVGIEGPRDGEVGVLFARRADDSVIAAITSFSTHPNSVEGESFYSADVPGEVRRVVRAVLGEDVGVVYLTGAAADTAPSIMVDNPENIQPWRGETGLKRSGAYLGGEILRVISATTEPMVSQSLKHEHTVLDIPIREWDEAISITEFGGGMYDYFENSKNNWGKRRADGPVKVPLHAIRIGDAAICMNPAELYCIFGLEIKKHSPASVTLVAELTDAWVGYVPTPQAVRHGGYSAQASDVTFLEPDAGWKFVETTRELLDRAFSEPSPSSGS
jgi:neutral ceramidase